MRLPSGSANAAILLTCVSAGSMTRVRPSASAGESLIDVVDPEIDDDPVQGLSGPLADPTRRLAALIADKRVGLVGRLTGQPNISW